MAAGCGLVYVLLLASLLVQSWGRMICWQAMLTCDMEEQCSFAYRQYTQACESVLAGEDAYNPSKRRCPSHCINAIIQLNSTKAGPALEDCDCASDETCKATKRAIEPCMPRTRAGSGSSGRESVMGCTAARRVCERDFRCSKSLTDYLRHCGPLFNGVNCPISCMTVISEMITMPKALLLNECVCDGMERAICESIKESMVRLCFSPDGGPSSSGESDDDFEEDDEDPSRPTLPSRSGAHRVVPTLWTCIVLLVLQGYQ